MFIFYSNIENNQVLSISSSTNPLDIYFHFQSQDSSTPQHTKKKPVQNKEVRRKRQNIQTMSILSTTNHFIKHRRLHLKQNQMHLLSR